MMDMFRRLAILLALGLALTACSFVSSDPRSEAFAECQGNRDQWAEADVLIFLNPDVSDREQVAIETLLAADELVRSHAFVGQWEAYRELDSEAKERGYFSASDLPPRFRVVVQEDTSDDALVAAGKRYQAEPGVFAVATIVDPCRPIGY